MLRGRFVQQAGVVLLFSSRPILVLQDAIEEHSYPTRLLAPRESDAFGRTIPDMDAGDPIEKLFGRGAEACVNRVTCEERSETHPLTTKYVIVFLCERVPERLRGSR